MRTQWFPILLGSLFIILISVPYMIAYQNAGEAYKFGGFLLNPIDGNTYLAKMYQGWQGSWRFVLPYTIEQGKGGYLFLFYLAQGHLARISGSSTQLMFHLFRIASGIALVTSLWNFFGKVFFGQRTRQVAFGLALFGSGMGWLVSAFGVFSADFWVAEGYPFLSAYANPHFPLGLAIMLWVMTPRSPESKEQEGFTSRQKLIFIGLSFSLAIVMPFGVVIAAVILTGLLLWEDLDSLPRTESKSNYFNQFKSQLFQSQAGQKLLFLILGGAPVLIYQIWVSRSDPILAAWNTQNITISPPFWEMLIAYAPILLVAIPGIYFALKSGERRTRILLLWAGLGLLLLYVPWTLQRRFISGYLIPLAGLAAITLEIIISRKKIFGVVVLVLLIVLMIPTNLMILLGGFQAVENKDESIFLSDDEYQSLMWIGSNTDEKSVILASPEMGLLVPAYSGRRVWYGHPFETPDALTMETHLLNLFSGANSDFRKTMLEESDYLFYGSRERELGEFNLGSGFELVFESGDTRVYRID